MFIMMSFYLFNLNIITWMLSMLFLLMNKKMLIEWQMFFFNSNKINYIIFIDWMTLIFISTVCLISSMVILYSMDYMKEDLFVKRFMMLIIIFVSSMIFMILSPNMISILLGWDGLGLSSYCLVAYYQNKKSFNSSMITILMNRVGDIMILISIGLMMKMGSWNFLMFKSMPLLMMMLIFIASITKSAQIPFSTWLPLAMAAPTPISSLVHSSTLVTAGVFLLIRFSHTMNNTMMNFMLIISCLTMFIAGSSANFEFDLKKIIALSTLSQLGLMIMTISFKQINLAFFHLITHAMFKSLLFLCSGIIIHNYFNHQDIRFISFMNLNMPFITITFNIASLALCGLPFLSGFYSKDLIIEMFMMNNNFNSFLMTMMMYLSMSLTVMYSLRLLMFISIKNIKINMNNFYNSLNIMNYSIITLLLMTIFYGSLLNWMIFSSLNMTFLPKMIKMCIFMFMILGIILTITNNFLPMKTMLNKKIIYLFYFMNFMWLTPNLFKKNKINILKLNNKLIMMNDLSWLEYYIKIKIYMIKKIKDFNMNNLNYMIIFSMMMMLTYILMFL